MKKLLLLVSLFCAQPVEATNVDYFSFWIKQRWTKLERMVKRNYFWIEPVLAGAIVFFGLKLFYENCPQFAAKFDQVACPYDAYLRQTYPTINFSASDKSVGVTQGSNCCAFHAVANAFYMQQNPDQDLSHVRAEVDAFTGLLRVAIPDLDQFAHEEEQHKISLTSRTADYTEACRLFEAAIEQEIAEERREAIRTEKTAFLAQYNQRNPIPQRPAMFDGMEQNLIAAIIETENNAFTEAETVFRLGEFLRNSPNLTDEQKRQIPAWANPANFADILMATGGGQGDALDTLVAATRDNTLVASVPGTIFDERGAQLTLERVQQFQNGTPLVLVFQVPAHWLCARMVCQNNNLDITIVDSMNAGSKSWSSTDVRNKLREVGSYLATYRSAEPIASAESAVASAN